MAKRKRLTAPDAEALRELESGFAAKPLETKSSTPPIAKIAGEAAGLAGMAGVADRVDAENFRVAQEAGLLAVEIPIESIDPEYIRRDRIVENEDEMQELVASIRANGLRAPVEVVKTEDGYGLIAGFRRIKALQRLNAEGRGATTVPAFVRKSTDSAGVYVNMVEENEVRADLSHYERGRIAVLAAGQGVFDTVEQAVDVLFAAASKSKRSKVRSFARVHEALGDLLTFPTELSERAGLKLASALRDGAQVALRRALSRSEVQSASDEWKVIEGVLTQTTTSTQKSGGRPAKNVPVKTIKLRKGGELKGYVSDDGFKIELKDRSVSSETLQSLMIQLKQKLG